MKMLKFLSLLFFILCVPPAIRADISIYDNWDTDGRLLLKDSDWGAEFRKEEGTLIISSNKKTLKILPFNSEGTKSEKITLCKVVEDNKEKGVEIRTHFSAGHKEIEGSFFFYPEGTVRITPSRNMEGVFIFTEISFGVLPGIFLEDIIYKPKEYPSLAEIYVPSENLFLGLLKGRDGILVCTWPEGDQKVKLLLKDGKKQRRLIRAVELKLDGKSIYLGILAAAGIWHKEELLPSFLEKDVEINWKRPFPAEWKTQLLETGVKTTYFLGDKKDEIWRPNVGHYVYPAWVEGEKAFFHLSKKIPPKGQAFIYSMQGHKKTTLEFVKKFPTAEMFAKIKEEKSYTSDPREAPSVGFPACWGTGLVRGTIFRVGAQAREKEFLREYTNYLAGYVAVIQQRHREYYTFIQEMKITLDFWMQKETDNSEVLSFLEQMKQSLKKVDYTYHKKMEWAGKSPSYVVAYSDELAERLKALIEVEGTEPFPECDHIVATFNRLSWAHHEGMGKAFGTVVREWFLKAGYACIDKPQAVKYAQEIRKSIWNQLKCRNWETIHGR